ncbi:MAG: BlaI/MecI/CopY family transcriptional regulator [Bacteroidota bacterium]
MPADQLSPLQLAVMEVLWDRPEATVADVHAALDRGLALTTVGTILARLAKQGVVAHRKDGRALVYRAAVTRRSVRRSMTGSLLDSLFGGDPTALVSHLLREDELSAADLDRLRARLDAFEAAQRAAPDSTPPTGASASDGSASPSSTTPDSTDV